MTIRLLHTLISIALFTTNCCFVFSEISTRYCKHFIKRSTIENSWQSTSYEDTCFNTSSPVFDYSPNYWGYFHSNTPRSTDKYHWFVVKLQNQTLLSSVTIVSRANQKSRAEGIEIWTSNSSDLSFGEDHCNSSSSEMLQSKDPNGTWEKCGTGPDVNSTHSGQNFTINCTRIKEVRFILLRKPTMVAQRDTVDMMNFQNMWISEALASVEIEPSSLLQRGSNLTVKCKTICLAHNAVQLCLPNNTCISSDQSELTIESIRPIDSGTYACQIGDERISSAELIVLYSPDKVAISPLSPVSCGDLGPPTNVEFAMISDDGYPEPNHICSAWNSSDRQLNMKIKTARQKLAHGVKSTWLCSGCSSAANLTVACSAIQSNGRNLSVEWKCNAPDNLAISLKYPISCYDTSSSANVTFEMVSSAANPMPNHSCSAWDSGVLQRNMQLDSRLENSTGKVKSIWLCSDCGRAANLTVRCSAFKANVYNLTNAKNFTACPEESYESCINWFLPAIIALPACAIAMLAGVFIAISLKRRQRHAIMDASVSLQIKNEASISQLDEAYLTVTLKPPIIALMTPRSLSYGTDLTQKFPSGSLCEYATIENSGAVIGTATGTNSRLDLRASWAASEHDSDVTEHLSIVGDDLLRWGN